MRFSPSWVVYTDISAHCSSKHALVALLMVYIQLEFLLLYVTMAQYLGTGHHLEFLMPSSTNIYFT